MCSGEYMLKYNQIAIRRWRAGRVQRGWHRAHTAGTRDNPPPLYICIKIFYYLLVRGATGYL